MGAISKTIHYCWFGGKALPRSAKNYIKTWVKYFPGYEIKEWNESNFDVNIVPYTADAYNAGKFAFVSDFARFWILYHFGGVYFDVDVEAVRPIDDILADGPFMAMERAVRPEGRTYGIAPGLGIAAEAGNELYRQILEHYGTLQYGECNEQGRQLNVVDIISRVFLKYGWKDEDVIQDCGGIKIYPTDYFCPEIPRGKSEYELSQNTRTIHHYAGTWLPKSVRIKNKIGDFVGPSVLNFLVRVKSLFKR